MTGNELLSQLQLCSQEELENQIVIDGRLMEFTIKHGIHVDDTFKGHKHISLCLPLQINVDYYKYYPIRSDYKYPTKVKIPNSVDYIYPRYVNENETTNI